MSGGARALDDALMPVEDAARRQGWDGERPWRRRSHVWWEGDVLTIDLHDLKARNAGRAVEAVLSVADQLDAPAVAFIVGRGRHSLGKGVLPEVVGQKLAAACGPHPVWTARPIAGRWMLALDPARAPAVATGRLGWVFWLGVAAFAALAVWACLGGPR